MPDELTLYNMRARRNEILDAMNTQTFTPEQYQELYAELAELAIALGPDQDDEAEAKLYRDVREQLTHLSALRGAAKNTTGMIDHARRQWHPKTEDTDDEP